MPHVHIGLDFGTSQTKVCLQHLDATPRAHEFVEFDSPSGPSFYLPSRISLDGDRVRTGYAASPAAFRFFKIAAAEDEHFRAGAPAGAAAEPRYDAARFSPHTPELLSVLYLARTLLEVEARVRSQAPTPAARKGGFLLRAVPPVPQQTTFTVQLGIPTEYLSVANRLRKRKFETILVLADQLAQRLASPAAFDAASASTLATLVATLNEALGDGEDRGLRLDAALDAQGLSVFPESAAGLAALTSSGRLDPGPYATIDIGGGSTDVSFFYVDADRATSYLASESLLLASNDVYRAVAGSADPEAVGLAERAVRDAVRSGPAYRDAAWVEDAVDVVTCQIYNATRRLFVGRVWEKHRADGRVFATLRGFSGQPCFVYGGGSALPVRPKRQRITVHNNGTSTSLHADSMVDMRRDALNDHLFTSHVEVRPGVETVREHGHLLAVAFGLSFPQRPGQAVWSEQLYTAGEVAGARLTLVPHPSNADRYVYDVVGRRWFGT